MDKNRLSRLSAAMHSTPSNYEEAREKYERDLQWKSDETWQWASNNYEILQEFGAGTRDFRPIVCRIEQPIEPKTGLNLGDDFKKLIFPKIKTEVPMGTRFQFADSWWIVANTTNLMTTTSGVIVRRMNNVLKFIHNGRLYEEPCVIEYALKYSNVYYNNLYDIPQGTAEIFVQANDVSRLIDYNYRFILDSEVYKVKTLRDFLRNKTFDRWSAPLINLSVFVDIKAPDDDFVNGIASMNRFNPNVNPPIPEVGYEVVVNPTTPDLLIGETVVYTVELFHNGALTGEPFQFTASGVPPSHYELLELSGNSFSIRNIEPHFGNPLTIRCENPNMSRDILILLKGLY